jgi:hypothetical protein
MELIVPRREGRTMHAAHAAAASESQMDNNRLNIKRIAERILIEGDPFWVTNESIAQMKKRLDASLFVLFKVLDTVEPREARKNAFKGLDELMSTMYDAIDMFHNIDLVATKQAYVAQLAKLRKSAQRSDQLFKCILAEAEAQNLKGLPLCSGNEGRRLADE